METTLNRDDLEIVNVGGTNKFVLPILLRGLSCGSQACGAGR